MENYEVNLSDTEKIKDYEDLWEKIKNGSGSFVEIPEKYHKHDFLKWLSEEKPVLFHGSNNKSIDVLVPRQANDKAKKSGNQVGVYAVKDPIIPIFYAIKDEKSFRGYSRCGKSIDNGNGNTEYHFSVEGDMLNNPKAFSDGVVYILDNKEFEEQKDDHGRPCGEYINYGNVKPLCKILFSVSDFPYYHDIKVY